MAKKKSRVPTPPRGVQASKRRDDPRKQRDPRQLRMLGGVLAVGVLVALVVVAVVLATGGGNGGGSLDAQALAASGCVAEDFPPMGRQHAAEVKESFQYNSFPPTSGPHHPQPAIWNLYDQPVEQIRLIHNLEHGGVVLQYGDQVGQAEVGEIVAWYRADPDGVVVALLPELRDKIAFTAWTHLMTCSQGFDEAAASSFRDAYRFHGPEELPREILKPGT